MKPRHWDTILHELAERQSGYFTAAQARSAGLHQVRLVQLERSEDLERVSRGDYASRATPFPLGQYTEAALWPQVRRPGAQGIVSHESALAVYGIWAGTRLRSSCDRHAGRIDCACSSPWCDRQH